MQFLNDTEMPLLSSVQPTSHTQLFPFSSLIDKGPPPSPSVQIHSNTELPSSPSVPSMGDTELPSPRALSETTQQSLSDAGTETETGRSRPGTDNSRPGGWVWSCYYCRHFDGNYRAFGVSTEVLNCPECGHVRCESCYMQWVEIPGWDTNTDTSMASASTMKNKTESDPTIMSEEVAGDWDAFTKDKSARLKHDLEPARDPTQSVQ